MVIVMGVTATAKEIEDVERQLIQWGLTPHPIQGTHRKVIAVVGDTKTVDQQSLLGMPGIEKVVPILKPYKLVGREIKPENTVIRVGDVEIGGEEIVLMAGPCAIENEEQLLNTALAVKKAGGKILRGGAFKPRTSPYSFQGLKKEGLMILSRVKELAGLPVVTEVMDIRDLELVADYTDIVQIGARNMQNFSLLQEAGRLRKPVLLKRGLSATIEEWLMAAEYILAEGNYQVILCERGIRTFEGYTRNTLDISAIPVVKELSHLPVIVDPSHSTGHWRLVNPVSRAAIAAGVDGLIVEVHYDPRLALCDGPQSLNPDHFSALVKDLSPVAAAVGRSLRSPLGIGASS